MGVGPEEHRLVRGMKNTLCHVALSHNQLIQLQKTGHEDELKLNEWCFLAVPSSQLFVVVVWKFELYMLPLALLLLLVWNYVFSSGRESTDMVRTHTILPFNSSA